MKNNVFARLYIAQTISLLGDSLTWVGLALLAFDLAGKNSALVLSAALTLRVSAFVLLSPVAGAIADKYDRKIIMILTHLARMVIVCMLPLVTEIGQFYLLVFSLNVFNAFFTPTYKATIPLVTSQEDYQSAIALSGATYQFLGVIGPGIAGGLAAFMGRREIFFLDGLSFLIAAILIFSLPGSLKVDTNTSNKKTWQAIKDGTFQLWGDGVMRYGLLMELVVASAGAMILVNSVGYVQNNLKLGSVEYGWVMSAFGIGATFPALILAAKKKNYAKTTYIFWGALIINLVLLPATGVGLNVLMLLWLIAGAAETCVSLPTQTLIAERVSKNVQGSVYGAHFAWSHLWWAIGYPLAGWLGVNGGNLEFFYGGLLGLVLLIIVQVFLSPSKYFWHEHEHRHDQYHTHEHFESVQEVHNHFHRHPHYHPPH